MLLFFVLQDGEKSKIASLSGKLGRFNQKKLEVKCQSLRDLLSYSSLKTDSTNNVTASLEHADTRFTEWEDKVKLLPLP